MIFEREQNSNLDEWMQVWQPAGKKITREEIRERLKVCYNPVQQDKYWQGVGDTASMYHGKRQALQDVYQELFEYLFSKYLPDVSSGLEFGCGPSASLYRLLSKRFSGRWCMVDLNRSSPYQAKFYTRTDRIVKGSFHFPPFKDGSQELVAGLNSFETTLHLRYVVRKMIPMLKEGGYFLAMQDVLPSEFTTVAREFFRSGEDVRVKLGEKTPVLIKTGGVWMDTRSYHIETLRRIGRRLGLNEVFCGIIEAAGVYPLADHHEILFLNDYLKIDRNIDDNSFSSTVNKFIRYRDFDVPDGFMKERTSANVLVLKK